MRGLRGVLLDRMPALIAAAAWSDDSDGECGDGCVELSAAIDTRPNVGDGGNELRSGAMAGYGFISRKLANCLSALPSILPRSPDVALTACQSLHDSVPHDCNISCLPPDLL